MIYLLYGTDTEKAREKLHSLVATLITKKPDASHTRMNDENFDAASLEELIGGLGLFSQKVIIELDNVFRNKEIKELVVEKIKELGESENIFIILEGTLDKATLKKFEKHSEKIQEFASAAEAHSDERRRADFNIFSLTDAFGKRDRKQLWVLYAKAKMKDISDEEIHGILFWQVKAMAQAASASNPKDAGLNPFVYQKSQSFLRNFSEAELKKTSADLVSLYHNARRGIIDFDSALEKFILEV